MSAINKGFIILLNGVSSSGKTTIATALLKKLDTFFHLSIDEYAYFIEKMETREKRMIIPIETEFLFHSTVNMFSDKAVNIIVDHILHNDFTKTNWSEVLSGYPVLYVGVHCHISDIDDRERARGNRIIGQGKSQLDFTHKNLTYDVEINTSTSSVDENAAKILDALCLKY